MRQYVTARLEPLLAAQIDNAVGPASDHARRKTGKFERVTGDPEQIDEALKTDNGGSRFTRERLTCPPSPIKTPGHRQACRTHSSRW